MSYKDVWCGACVLASHAVSSVEEGSYAALMPTEYDSDSMSGAWRISAMRIGGVIGEHLMSMQVSDEKASYDVRMPENMPDGMRSTFVEEMVYSLKCDLLSDWFRFRHADLSATFASMRDEGQLRAVDALMTDTLPPQSATDGCFHADDFNVTFKNYPK